MFPLNSPACRMLEKYSKRDETAYLTPHLKYPSVHKTSTEFINTIHVYMDRPIICIHSNRISSHLSEN